jgi:hypothetical protein
MSSCTYIAPGAAGSALRIDEKTFNDRKARADFLPVAGEVLVFNLIPFFENLRFLFDLLATPPPAEAQK